MLKSLAKFAEQLLFRTMVLSFVLSLLAPFVILIWAGFESNFWFGIFLSIFSSIVAFGMWGIYYLDSH